MLDLIMYVVLMLMLSMVFMLGINSMVQAHIRKQEDTLYRKWCREMNMDHQHNHAPRRAWKRGHTRTPMPTSCLGLRHSKVYTPPVY